MRPCRPFLLTLLYSSIFTLLLFRSSSGYPDAQASPSKACEKSEFACRIDETICVPLIKWQDGVVDCPDGSDEECLPWQYDCKLGKPRCVNLRNLNDGSIDCMSGFDEECPAHFFVCMDRSDCISPERYLDGRMDCRDGSDEQHLGCTQHLSACQAAHFLCRDRSQCVPTSRFQDGVSDCHDASDEECTLFQFQCLCGEPRCIDFAKFGDGVKDCADGSDEKANSTASIGSCSDGTVPRNGSIVAPVPPPGPPMIPCSATQPNTCKSELGEMCLVIGGAPRCMCQMGLIRPPGSVKCMPPPMIRQLDKTGTSTKTVTSSKTTSPRRAQGSTISRPSTTPQKQNPLILRNAAVATSSRPPSTVRPAPKKAADTSSLPVLKRSENATVSKSTCDPNDNRSCPGTNEICSEISANVFGCACGRDFTRDPTRGGCVAMVDECADPLLNNCDPNAVCMDNPLSYECLCKEGFIDMSEVPRVRPGVTCLPLINECASPDKNECDRNATCLDLPGGYLCRCKEGFIDVSPGGAREPGRQCRKLVNECEDGTAQCHEFATCIDHDDGYQCRCPVGYVDLSVDPVTQPGRQCAQLINECGGQGGNDCDPVNGECADTPEGFVCQCLPGFIDRNPQLPGRNCTAASDNPCQDYSLHDCDKNAICKSSQPGYFECQCPSGFVDLSPDRRFPGRVCKTEENECRLGTHRCDPNADCTDTKEGYSCHCKAGWTDSSPDLLSLPGRNCSKADQCATFNCSADADCRESTGGPVCQCRIGFADVSQQQGQASGHVCKKLLNECTEKKHDCSSNAACIDTNDAFTCRCADGYRDESPDVINRPGRVCVQSFTPEPPECDVNDPLSCDQRKAEVCVFVEGTYKCKCPAGFSRLPDGRCLVINECSEGRLNDCGANAQCIDLAEGFSCQCQTGYADISPNATSKPGRICRQRVNECVDTSRYGVDCHVNAVCVDTDEAYTCRCRPGFADVSENYNRMPGRRCVEAVNECADSASNDCAQQAICEDAKEGYTCRCRVGFVDASPNVTHYPGRICNKPKGPEEIGGPTSLPQLEACDVKNPRCKQNEVCIDKDSNGVTLCECAPNAFRFEDGSCRLFTGCENNSDCDKNALCSNAFDTYRCQCRPGFLDISPDPVKRPGRVCKELINECATNQHECSPFATCMDSREGYACICKDGYTDTSSQFGLGPGRRCSNSSNECASPELNTCDENADCVDTQDGYTCQCYDGFIDVSSSANLKPGRVCTVQTTCPKQATDLMFLIDGSGSIGSYVFRNEVLRFVREFVDLFDIGLDKTRVGVIQYSDQIRHEFDLGQFKDKASVLQGIDDIQYLTGLTRTGAAIQHMVTEGFSDRRGARPISDTVSRVAIVITDGRSQDNVTEPSLEARKKEIQMFAIGVTDHVLASELEEIAGSPNRWFYVDRFKDLDTRLRSLIQKAACPAPEPTSKPTGPCNPTTQTGCDRSRNEVCVARNGQFSCVCPDGFGRNPATQVCGGEVCNQQLLTSCPDPEVCKLTPLNNYRCVCPPDYERHVRTGFCISTSTPSPTVLPSTDECGSGRGNKCPAGERCVTAADGSSSCQCEAGLQRNPKSGACGVPGSCDPTLPDPCDARKRESCLLHSSGAYHTCQCPANYRRHSVTGVCLIDECASGKHDCDKSARCIDTDDSYICSCPNGFLDHSPDPLYKPGRVCIAEVNECTSNAHNCSPNALCTDTPDSFICRCKPGYVDFSPNPNQFGGIICQEVVNECSSPSLNTCHKDALCIDTTESYKCICKANFVDMDELRNPGRNCQQLHVNDRCSPGKNDCDRNARCTPRGDSEFDCVCPAGYRDKSPNPNQRPGRVCIPLIPECDNPSLNDCDSPDRAICTDTDDGYLCRCRQGFLDISPDPARKPGRLCKPLENECLKGVADCAKDGGICEDTPDSYTCRCAINYLDVSLDRQTRPGRQCKRLVNECTTGQNDCSQQATCTDTEDSFVCACPSDHIDVSPDPVRRPGRRCLLRINECKENKHDCSPNADCVDTPESFRCKCRNDFLDESPDQQNRPGRVCRPQLLDECRLGTHDCSTHATCSDQPNGFTCQCNADFLDESPNRVTRPGRMCVAKPTPPPEECRVDLETSCKVALNEVCRLVDGVPKCACPINYSRDRTTNACTVVNECQFPQLNDCDQNAECIDQPIGYNCRCKAGFKDLSAVRPGRNCQPLVNECQFPHLNDCHQNANCTDLEDGYACKCQQGFEDRNPARPGRVCQQQVNECASPTLNSCDPNADCTDTQQGYTCKCRAGFFDVSPSPNLQGRGCRQIVNECTKPNLNDCHQSAVCTDTLDSYTCACPANSRDISPNPSFPGRVCLLFENECLTDKHDCDPNAVCRDNEESFTCECAAGFTDRSPNKLSRPGRVCVQLIDECATARHTCSQQAECRDLEEGYTCECKDGFVDRSPDLRGQPGRVCGVPEVCPTNHQCSSAAVCEPLGGTEYRCTCIQGYVDQSADGLTGRVCVRANGCLDSRLNDCSPDAQCTNGPGLGEYSCQCLPGFEDAADQPGTVCTPIAGNRIAGSRRRKPSSSHRPSQTSWPSFAFAPPVTDNECRDPRLNNCSRNAICYDEPRGYRCECVRGFVDRSPDPKLGGRVCEPPASSPPSPRHPCQDPLLNDCHPAGTCKAQGASYTCECLQGYVDRSPDAQNKPGRVCVLTQPICLDPAQNDCHPAAICSETSGPEKYTCRCRDGYVDESTDTNRPGRICVEQVNECLDRALNDCDPIAVCEDRPKGYTCRCPVESKDQSPDPQRPGRRCFKQLDECRNPLMNNCSRFADCIDRENGYECRCRAGYHDGNPTHAGTVCTYIINECESTNLNDCDRHADCIDQPGGYSCQCRQPYVDESPDKRNQPGRICRFNECNDPNYNKCARDAICQDTEDGFICQCKEGFYDNSPNPQEPGRVCIGFNIQPTSREPPVTIPTDAIRCGPINLCYVSRNEVCIGGQQCGCRPGQSRRDSSQQCTDVDIISLAFRIVRQGNEPLMYSSQFGQPSSPRYVQIVDEFNKEMDQAVGGTAYAPRYVTTDVSFITHPKTVNSSWPDGLLFNFTVATVPGRPPIDICDLWDQLMASLQRTNGAIGGGQLIVADDNDLLDPCRRVVNGPECAPGLFCNANLGEVCIAGSVCGCPLGQNRDKPTDICRQVEAWVLPLWVIRRNNQNLVYNQSIGNPLHPINRELVQLFESGISQSYAQTPLAGGYVAVDVNDIVDPMFVNATWDKGIMYNFTVYFRRGSIRLPSDVFTMLVKYMVDRNNYQVGTSGLYINPYQPDPFRPCFQNNCHPKGICIDLGPNAYRCECGPDYRDLNPADPGRRCLPNFGYNECEKPEDNECSPNARCIDQENLYKCECLPSFTDASPQGSLPGSLCVLDYCSDVNFCPTNTTCVNEEDQALCKCDSGFVDIRRSERRLLFGIKDSYCMNIRDVNECALGLTNCSGVAECTDVIFGYECRCPVGYIDGNPELPGRVCGALLCDLCNGHGDCVHNQQTQNVTCVCTDGWAGEYCNVAPSNASLILLIILAILFLLLTLCCLLYFCLKCRCIKGRGLWYREPLFTYRKGAWPWSTLEQSNSSESGAEFSGMSSAVGQDYYPEIGIPRAKLKPSSRDRRHEQLDASHLQSYLDEGVRIPRARLSGSGSLERDGSVMFSDVHQEMAAGTSDSYDSASETSSDYTMREEVERRVTTDVTKSETRKTVTADVHGQATAEFHVYPPIEASSSRKGGTRFGGLGGVKKEVTKRWNRIASDTATTSKSLREDGLHTEADRDESTIFESGRLADPSDMFSVTASERDRGQSIAEFSVGNLQARESEWGETGTEFSQNREMSEYTEREDSDSEVSHSLTDAPEDDMYDKKVLVKKTQGYQPDASGQGGTERYTTEVSTKTQMRETTRR